MEEICLEIEGCELRLSGKRDGPGDLLFGRIDERDDM